MLSTTLSHTLRLKLNPLKTISYTNTLNTKSNIILVNTIYDNNMSSRNLSTTDSNNNIPYSVKQQKMGRPLSPHVTIYSFPISAVTSILVRGTGMALSVGTMGIGAGALVGIDPVYVLSTIGSISGLNILAKFSVSFPFIYHYLGGLRHVYWDENPEELNNVDVENLSYKMLGASIATSVIVSLFL